MDSDELVDLAAEVGTRQEFIDFLQALSNNLIKHSEDWENTTIETYLDGIRRWTISAENYYKNFDIPIDCDFPSWRLFAEILLAASVYE